ncbi:MAG: acyl-CoA dehydrogenase family protein, partial [Myxococcota bacterium]
AVVSVGAPPLMPFAADASIFLAVEGGRVWRCVPTGPVEAVATLGGEPWGRVALERAEELPGGERAVALYELTLAAFLAAAGRRLSLVTAEHARTRRQFGQVIGEFQAVAHPLADCATRLGSATALARSAAFHFEAGAPRARAIAGAARLSAHRAAVEAAHTCHQLFGAIGITMEGPAFHLSRRILQLAIQPPGEEGARTSLLAHFGL